MRIIHSALGNKIERIVKYDASFLLANKIGGYCWLSSKPDSRYNGVFFNINGKMYKVIEDIKIKSLKSNCPLI